MLLKDRSVARAVTETLSSPLLVQILLTGIALTHPFAVVIGANDAPPRRIEELESRAAILLDDATRLESFYDVRVAPVEEVLAPFHDDVAFVRAVSVALVREGERAGVDPRALASVLLVENAGLDPTARSTQGATGLMQVMPFHAGRWGCESNDLTNVDANICHGARIFSSYLKRYDGDVDRSLLAYNGCVAGTNTPDCFQYPSHVYSNAGRLAISRWLSTQ
jgi:soluble lytic murein transglycosylase-like protein